MLPQAALWASMGVSVRASFTLQRQVTRHKGRKMTGALWTTTESVVTNRQQEGKGIA